MKQEHEMLEAMCVERDTAVSKNPSTDVEIVKALNEKISGLQSDIREKEKQTQKLIDDAKQNTIEYKKEHELLEKICSERDTALEKKNNASEEETGHALIVATSDIIAQAEAEIKAEESALIAKSLKEQSVVSALQSIFLDINSLFSNDRQLGGLRGGADPIDTNDLLTQVAIEYPRLKESKLTEPVIVKKVRKTKRNKKLIEKVEKLMAIRRAYLDLKKKSVDNLVAKPEDDNEYYILKNNKSMQSDIEILIKNEDTVPSAIKIHKAPDNKSTIFDIFKPVVGGTKEEYEFYKDSNIMVLITKPNSISVLINKFNKEQQENSFFRKINIIQYNDILQNRTHIKLNHLTNILLFIGKPSDYKTGKQMISTELVSAASSAAVCADAA